MKHGVAGFFEDLFLSMEHPKPLETPEQYASRKAAERYTTQSYEQHFVITKSQHQINRRLGLKL